MMMKALTSTGLADPPDECEVRVMKAAHSLLEPHPVRIPFAPRLVENLTTANPEITPRVYELLEQLIKASALLHQRVRERKGDCIVASEDDYEIVRRSARGGAQLAYCPAQFRPAFEDRRQGPDGRRPAGRRHPQHGPQCLCTWEIGAMSTYFDEMPTPTEQGP
jgi:hypothetical protein